MSQGQVRSCIILFFQCIHWDGVATCSQSSGTTTLPTKWPLTFVFWSCNRYCIFFRTVTFYYLFKQNPQVNKYKCLNAWLYVYNNSFEYYFYNLNCFGLNGSNSVNDYKKVPPNTNSNNLFTIIKWINVQQIYVAFFISLFLIKHFLSFNMDGSANTNQPRSVPWFISYVFLKKNKLVMYLTGNFHQFSNAL